MELNFFSPTLIQRTVFTKIAIFAQKSGYSYATTEYIASVSETNERNVQRAVKKLIEQNLIYVKKIIYSGRTKIRCYALTELGKNSKNFMKTKQKAMLKNSNSLVHNSVQKAVQNSKIVATNVAKFVAANVATSIEHKELKELKEIKEKSIKKTDFPFSQKTEKKEEKLEKLKACFGEAKVEQAIQKLKDGNRLENIKNLPRYLSVMLDNEETETRMLENAVENEIYVESKKELFDKLNLSFYKKSKFQLVISDYPTQKIFDLKTSPNMFLPELKWYLQEIIERRQLK